jgi:CspA family cold shock protein
MAIGKVKWLNRKKGCGFIIPEGSTREKFVHSGAFQTEKEFRALKEETSVQFDTADGKKGMHAENVTVLS